MMGGVRGLGMMWFGPGFMGGWFSTFFFLIPMISGIMVIIGAIMMGKRSDEGTIWGIIVLAFSVLGLMGIGLAMAKRFLSSQGGTIKVETTSDKGTTFLIRIPK